MSPSILAKSSGFTRLRQKRERAGRLFGGQAQEGGPLRRPAAVARVGVPPPSPHAACIECEPHALLAFAQSGLPLHDVVHEIVEGVGEDVELAAALRQGDAGAVIAPAPGADRLGDGIEGLRHEQPPDEPRQSQRKAKGCCDQHEAALRSVVDGPVGGLGGEAGAYIKVLRSQSQRNIAEDPLRAVLAQDFSGSRFLSVELVEKTVRDEGADEALREWLAREDPAVAIRHRQRAAPAAERARRGASPAT